MSNQKHVSKEVPIIGKGSKEVTEAINKAIDSMVERFNPVFESFQQAIAEIGRRLEVVEEIHKTRPAFPDTITVNVVNHDEAELLKWDEDDKKKTDINLDGKL